MIQKNLQLEFSKRLLKRYTEIIKLQNQPKFLEIQKQAKNLQYIPYSSFEDIQIEPQPIQPQIIQQRQIDLSKIEPIRFPQPQFFPQKLQKPEWPTPEIYKKETPKLIKIQEELKKTYSLVYVKELNKSLVNITLNKDSYRVEEPEEDLAVINLIKDWIKEKVEDKPELVSDSKFINSQIERACKLLNRECSKQKIFEVRYYLIRDVIGLKNIHPLLCDPNILTIYCEGVNKPIKINYKKPHLEKIPSNIIFKTGEELDSFIKFLAKKTNQSISEDDPILHGTLQDNSTVQATLGTGVIDSKFTITKGSDSIPRSIPALSAILPSPE